MSITAPPQTEKDETLKVNQSDSEAALNRNAALLFEVACPPTDPMLTLIAWYGEQCLPSAWFNFKAMAGLIRAWLFRAGRQDVMADNWAVHCKRTLPLRWVGSPRQNIWSHWDAQIMCACGCIPWFSFQKTSERVNAFIHLLLLWTVFCPEHAATTNYKELPSYLHLKKINKIKICVVCASSFINSIRPSERWKCWWLLIFLSW